MAAAPHVSEDDAASLTRYLLSFRWNLRDDAQLRALVADTLPLWRCILARVPKPPTRGRALELGSPPFNITLLLARLRNYELSLTGAAADGRAEIMQEVESPEYGERHRFTCRCFDLERDRFPYADGTFDLVLFCEVLEHLTANPVHTLAEIHRVLRPGGLLVLSTPNVARFQSLLALVRGRNVYDPYHLGAQLQGSRHSREYTLAELGQLVGGCGFRLDRLEDVDACPSPNPLRRLARTMALGALARIAGGRYHSNLFVCATRTEQPFIWHFPPGIFDPGHLAFHVVARDPRVVMGENDSLHISTGWGTLERGPDGLAMRRCRVGDLYLVARDTAALHLVVTGGRGEVTVWRSGSAPELMAWQGIDAPAGVWHTVSVRLSRPVAAGETLHVRLDVPDGIGVREVTA